MLVMYRSPELKGLLLSLLFALVAPTVSAVSDKSNIWQLIAENRQLANLSHPRIDDKLHWYSQQSFYASNISLRAKPYLPYIVAELKKRNMPIELALLPIVESDFRMTKSQKGAAGIWQLMPLIAQHYNVPINGYYDGRFDLVLSTHAALSYLNELYVTFDKNWLLAIAAYNCGEGKVKEAIRINKHNAKPVDFWHLPLPQETKDYVPKLLAVNKLIANNPSFFPPVESISSTRIIDVEQPFSIIVIAELLQVPSAEILKLNRAYIADKSAPNGPFHLLLPKKLGITLEQVLLFSRYGKDKGYTVKKGDSLYRLANLTNTSISKLKALNRLTTDVLHIGQRLILPASSKSMPSLVREYAISRYIKRAKPEIERLEVSYQVKPSDSLWHIATLFDVTIKQLRDWNALPRKGIIKPGQELKIVITQAKAAPQNILTSGDITEQLPYFSISQTATLNN